MNSISLDEALKKGIEAHKAGKAQEADRYYTAILKADPKHPHANHNMGVLGIGFGKVEEALPFFKAALEVDPSVVQFWLSYIDALIKLERFEDAKAVIHQAEEANVDKEVLSKLIVKISSCNNDSPPEDTIKYILEDFDNAQFTKVVKKIDELTSSYPRSLFLYNLQASAYEKLNQLEKAIELYKKAIKIDPSVYSLFFNLGVVYRKIGRLPEAIESLKNAADLNSHNADIFNNMGLAFAKKGSPNEALDSYKKAIQINPKYPQAYYNMGNVYKAAKQFDKAIKSYQRAIEIKPDYIKAYNNLGIVYGLKHELETALQVHQKVISLDPKNSQAYNNLGTIYLELMQKNKALESFLLSQKYDSNFEPALLNLISSLGYFESEELENVNKVIALHKKIENLFNKLEFTNRITDKKIYSLLEKSLSCLLEYSSVIRYPGSQIYRYNSISLNCDRHMDIFFDHDIIPNFCFSCYKVQVETESVVELIKLFIVFDKFSYIQSFLRKCMIETRKEIPGFYKGLVYCRSLQEAEEISSKLNVELSKKIGSHIWSKVKRGCSEYPSKFPSFASISGKLGEGMDYNPKWQDLEDQYDYLRGVKKDHRRLPTSGGMGLSDLLIIFNWIEYSKGLGDKSLEQFEPKNFRNNSAFEIAKTRTIYFPFK